jgi:hypothetical protein
MRPHAHGSGGDGTGPFAHATRNAENGGTMSAGPETVGVPERSTRMTEESRVVAEPQTRRLP